MKILRVLGWLVLAVLALGVGTWFGARFKDGPIAMFPGGPLRGGELVTDPDVNFAFAADVQEIELESGGRSRTTWALVHEHRLYIPASLKFPPLKRWHLRALQEPAAVVRISGKRYAGTLERVDEPELRAALGAAATQKYPLPPGTSSLDDVWFFRFTPAPRPG